MKRALKWFVLVGMIGGFQSFAQDVEKVDETLELRQAMNNALGVKATEIKRAVPANGFAVAFSHDGKLLAAGSKVYRVADWRLVQSFDGFKNPQKVMFSPDDRYVYLGDGAEVKGKEWMKRGLPGMWKLDVQTGEKTELKDAQGAPAWILSASADGKTAMRVRDGKLEIVQLPEFKWLNTLMAGDVFPPIISPNGKRTLREDGFTTVNIGVVDQNWSTWFNLEDSSARFAFSPDAKYVVMITKAADGVKFQVMDIEKDSDWIAHATYKGEANSKQWLECVDAAVANDGKTLAALMSDQSVVTAMLPDLRLFRMIKKGSSQVSVDRLVCGGSSLAFSPDGNWLAVGGEAGRFTLLDAKKFRSPDAVHGHASEIVDAFFSADGKRIRTVDSQGKGCVWDSQTLELKNEYLLPYGYFLLHAKEDGQSLVCGTGDLMDSFADGDDGWLVSKVSWPLRQGRYGVQWIDDDTAVVSDSTNICVYDISTGRIMSKAMAPKPLPEDGRLSEDGKRLWYFDQDDQGKFRVLKADLKTAQLTDLGLAQSTHWAVNMESRAGLVPGGRHFYIQNDVMTIFDLQTLKPVSEKYFGGKSPLPCGFSADGKRYAVAETDQKSGLKRIRIHDVLSGKTEMAFEHTGAGIKTMRFSADGKQLLGVDEEGNVRVWAMGN